MNIYNRAFINFHHFYGSFFKADRGTSAYFIALLQMLQIAAISLPLSIHKLVLFSHNQLTLIVLFISLTVVGLNTLFYNEKRVDILLSYYDKLSDNQKNKSRIISISFFLLTVSVWIISICYLGYLHPKNPNL
jgi:uncharacterized membrane protein YjgN (DUF898 family)